jgi:hypothetical protein
MFKNRLQGVRGILNGSRVLTLSVAIGAAFIGGLGLAAPGYAGGAQGLPQAAMKVARKGAARANRQTAQTPQPQENRWGPVAPGRRDPFSPPPKPPTGTAARAQAEGISGPLPVGKRGLLIGDLRLEGIVRQESNNSMIAVVANPENRAFFLRENDAVYDGVVSKITPDSVTFTERVKEPNGQEATHEVTKRLSSGSGENR